MSKFDKVEINKSLVEVYEIEQNAFITIIDGWRIRVYFDVSKKEDIRIGQLIEVEHEGEINKPLSLKFKKLK